MWPNMQVVGWYSSKSNSSPEADAPSTLDAEVLREVMAELCDKPLVLVMNKASKIATERKLLPFFLFERNTTSQESQFCSLQFSLASEDSE